jgi:hypothetical protein
LEKISSAAVVEIVDGMMRTRNDAAGQDRPERGTEARGLWRGDTLA